jgi:hypothetical protein
MDLIRALEAKGVDLTCTVCRRRDTGRSDAGRYVLTPLDDPAKQSSEAVALRCDHCGFIQLHDEGVLLKPEM